MASVRTVVGRFMAGLPDGVERGALVEHFKVAGYSPKAVREALDELVDRDEVVEMRLLYHADHPEANDGPQLPPVT